MELKLLQAFIVLSVVVYWIFDYFDGKQIKDERYELIRLKTFEFMQKCSLTLLTIVAFGFLIFPEMPARVPVLLFVFSSLFGEIAGKLYYRSKF